MIQSPETDKDFEQLARLHKEGLGHLEYFLSSSSLDFIIFFYKTISKYDSTVLLVDKDETGFVRGYIFASGEKDRYLKRFFKENAAAIIQYSSAWIPTLKAILRRFTRKKIINYSQELLYMAVHAGYRGKKIGTALLIGAQNKIAEKHNECYLQVHSRNVKAHELYKALGFHDIYTFTSGPDEKIVMKKDFRVTSPDLAPVSSSSTGF